MVNTQEMLVFTLVSSGHNGVQGGGGRGGGEREGEGRGEGGAGKGGMGRGQDCLYHWGGC